jgi:hypothetical protein
MKPDEVVHHIDEYGAHFRIPKAYGNMTRDQIKALADPSLMQPAEVVRHIDEEGAAFAIPRAYGSMSREQMQALAEEYELLSNWRRFEERMDHATWAPQPRQACTEEQAAARAASPLSQGQPPALQLHKPQTGELQTGEPQTLVDRAIGYQARLSTPARRRAAFLRHFSRCRTVAEAAARTGIDGRTVRRWRRAIPAFAARCEEITALRRREAIESVVMAADQIETHPVFYRGSKVGEYTRRDRTLGLYLLKQADAQALRAEQRREAAAFEARVQAEVERQVGERISKMSAPGGHSEAREPIISSHPANGLTAGKADIALAR